MGNLTDIKEIKSIMARFGKSFTKSLGQNFLINSEVIDNIITGSDVNEYSSVLEIGPGIGVLTKALAEKAKKVVTVEIDKKLLPVLEYTLEGYNNITVINEDILKLDILKLCRENFGDEKVKVVANLPYYITTPIIMKLLEFKECFSLVTVMVQKEVAQRMAANAGNKDYASLTIAVQYQTKPVIIANVPPEFFMPPPKVSSSVIRLDILDKPAVTASDEKLFFRLVHASFAQRRKTFVNGITNAGIGITKNQISNILEELGFDADIRGEKLTLEDFAKITDKIKVILDN